jgi:hypothetical protein
LTLQHAENFQMVLDAAREVIRATRSSVYRAEGALERSAGGFGGD